MFCPKCGESNSDSSSFCQNCGTALTIAVPMATSAKKSTSGAKIAATVIVALLIGGALGYYLLSNGNNAYIAVTVYSTHITETVDIIVYVDGEIHWSYQGLTPGNSVYDTQYKTYSWPIWESAKEITIKAVSTGGGLGSQTDSELIIAVPDGKYNIRLYV